MRDPNDFFDRLERDTEKFATIEGELYFEYHRGTYTSQAEVKRLNRTLEGQLQTLEFLATVCQLAAKPAPSRQVIEGLWRTLLTNQFHDILPGSSIGEVYVRTRAELSETSDRVAALTQQLAERLSSPDAAPTPINPIGFLRGEVALMPDREAAFIEAGPFAAGRIIAFADRVNVEENGDGTIVLQNGALRAVLTADGHVQSLVHRETGRETFDGPANRFVLFDDRPTEYEAWDIDPFALETGREAAPANGGTILVRGPLRAEVKFERPLGKQSRLIQIIRLDAASKHLEFDTEIDWRERRTLAKVVFPIACKSSHASYETMFGTVERPTHANTDADLAQFEVPGHRWADLSGIWRLVAHRLALRLFDVRQRDESQPVARHDVTRCRRRHRRASSALCALSAQQRLARRRNSRRRSLFQPALRLGEGRSRWNSVAATCRRSTFEHRDRHNQAGGGWQGVCRPPL
jgi:alpha-mannosidase